MPQFIGKFTFKKVIHTGRYRSFEPKSHEIKIKRCHVGSISQIRYLGSSYKEDDGKFIIRLAVKKEPTEQEPASFKWITFVKKFNSVEAAKEFLIFNQKFIQEKYDLHMFKDW
ncbi:MAG: hypothetical protein WC346_05505 [Methanogenium sp.]|jgi:hypothetical protein